MHKHSLAMCARAGLGFDVSNATELALAEPYLGPGVRVQLCGPGWGDGALRHRILGALKAGMTGV
ncbi:MAG: hypothetical protein IOD12_07980 [Silvanigrellales bacterium]|nr:hypothetical protein [Silvanigrellales bacterium]